MRLAGCPGSHEWSVCLLVAARSCSGSQSARWTARLSLSSAARPLPARACTRSMSTTACAKCPCRRSLSQVQAAIVSGRAAPKGRYKWIASLRAKGSDFHFCTGSLIAPRVVMTAAHVRKPGALSAMCCLPHAPPACTCSAGLARGLMSVRSVTKTPTLPPLQCVTNSYAAWADLEQSLPDVRIGGWEYRGGRYERRAAVQAVVHEAFNPATLENDIALLLLDRPAAAAPVLLPANSELGVPPRGGGRPTGPA